MFDWLRDFIDEGWLFGHYRYFWAGVLCTLGVLLMVVLAATGVCAIVSHGTITAQPVTSPTTLSRAAALELERRLDKLEDNLQILERRASQSSLQTELQAIIWQRNLALALAGVAILLLAAEALRLSWLAYRRRWPTRLDRRPGELASGSIKVLPLRELAPPPA
jgi:hypothetical protein